MKADKTFVLFKEDGGNELASKMKPETKTCHKIIYIMKCVLDIYYTGINFRNICGLYVNYQIF